MNLSAVIWVRILFRRELLKRLDPLMLKVD